MSMINTLFRNWCNNENYFGLLRRPNFTLAYKKIYPTKPIARSIQITTRMELSEEDDSVEFHEYWNFHFENQFGFPDGINYGFNNGVDGMRFVIF